MYVVALARLISHTRERRGEGNRRRPLTATQAAEPQRSQTIDERHPRPVWIGYSVPLIAGLVVLSIPWLDLQLAWWMLAVYVLCGFAATAFRLVPLPMS